MPKRTIAPLFWLMFGAGGMLSALFGPALILITGIMIPHGWGIPESLGAMRPCSPLRAIRSASWCCWL
ncbi:hypothetical protein [Bradyrhizobium iriomotense]|uniref:hypothetical protein n=1 Tax=Bradyrhizobium iriomotense TaxID=441950 RepID=UPI0024BF4DB5|nr:hypothetical protein [Bradyrhizobium iriomotense]